MQLNDDKRERRVGLYFANLNRIEDRKAAQIARDILRKFFEKCKTGAIRWSIEI